MSIFVGADHAGYDLKEAVRAFLSERAMECLDLGPSSKTSSSYSMMAHQLADRLTANPGARGILVCGSGIGMSMAANRHRGIRAALVRSPYEAHLARSHNDANVLCLGERISGLGVALESVRIFLETPFEGGRHQLRVDNIELPS